MAFFNTILIAEIDEIVKVYNMHEKPSSEVQRLKSVISELSCLNEIAIAISSSMSVNRITEIIIDKCLKHLNAEQGAVFLIKKDENKEDQFKTYIRKTSNIFKDNPLHINLITGWMITHKGLLIINSSEDAKVIGPVNLKSQGIKTLLAAPLITRKGLVGILAIFNKKDDNIFTKQDSRFLGILGSQCAQVIEGARLYEEEKNFLAMNEELKIAHSIQQNLLPKFSNSSDEYPVYGINIPAREVGGDYFDIHHLDDEKIFVAIGDVVGKGVPAALLMSNSMAVQRSQLGSSESISLNTIAGNINKTLCRFIQPGQFITSLIGIYYKSKNEFEFISAGHPAPIIMNKNGAIEYEVLPDLVFGVIPDATYNSHKISIDKDSGICLYTDGVSEAFNENEEQFGEKRLMSFLWKEMDNSSHTICDRLLAKLTEYRGSASQSDDITVVIIKP